jgi:hypothetical protein
MIRHEKFSYEKTTKRIAIPFIIISVGLLAGSLALAGGSKMSRNGNEENTLRGNKSEHLERSESQIESSDPCDLEVVICEGEGAKRLERSEFIRRIEQERSIWEAMGVKAGMDACDHLLIGYKKL